MIVILTLYNNIINLVLALRFRDEIKDQIFIKRFDLRYESSSLIYFRSIKDIENIGFFK